MQRTYTIIVPALERKGPVNVAFDLGVAAAEAGWRVKVLYLSEREARNDTDFASEVRKFHMSDLWRLRGVIHTHCLRPDLLGWLISWNKKCYLVTTVHNFFKTDLAYSYSQFYVQIAWLLWSTALRRFAHVVCISDAMRRYYRRLLPVSTNLALIRNFRGAADEESSLPTPIRAWIEESRESGYTVLAYVGVLRALKNIDALVDGMVTASDCSLLVCGEGVDRVALENKVSKLGLSGRVKFAGNLRAPRSALALVDMLVLPSFSEGFPLVVLEAASVGVPSLMSNIAVHRELSTLGFGLTFDHRRFSNFSERIKLTLQMFPVPSSGLKKIWHEGYTPRAGFSNYAKFFDE